MPPRAENPPSPTPAPPSAPTTVTAADDAERDDEVVVEISVSKNITATDHEAPFSIHHYKFLTTKVNLAQVRMPTHSSREINDAHVKNLAKLFREKGFSPVTGTFVVVPTLDDNEPLKLDDEGSLISETWLVDGRHRYAALEYLCQEDGACKWGPIQENAPAACVQRRDGQQVSTLEILALSAHFNDLSSSVLKVSFLDHLYAAIQTAKVLALLRKHPGPLTVGVITKELQDRKTLGAIDQRQLRRYAAVAQKLAQREDFYNSLKGFCSSCPGIGLVHLNSRVLLSITHPSLWNLALASLRCLLLNGVKGSFELLHNNFYICVKHMFELVRKVATHKGRPLETLMDSELNITAHIQKSVFDYITHTMGRYAPVENQEAADNIRVRNLKKKLIQLLGDDLEPKPPSTGGVKKSKSKSSASPMEVVATTEELEVRRSTRKRAVVIDIPSDVDSEPEPNVQRATRKRKAQEVVSREEGEPRSHRNDATMKDITRHRPTKKRATSKSKKADSATDSVTEKVVSTFLRALQPSELTRMMGRLGVKIVSKESNPSLVGGDQTQNKAMSSAMPPVLSTFYDSFDDSLPTTLPDTWADPPPYTGSQNPDWLRFATKLPSKWPNRLPIEHVSPWLEALHVPHEHRAHSVITERYILRQNHHAVYHRAAHAFYKKLPVSALPDLSMISATQSLSTHEKLWCAAALEDDVALEFFGAKKEQLSTEGFCILESFLHDEQIPDSIGGQDFFKFKCPNPFFKALEDEATASFPGEQRLTDPAERTTWNITQNVSGQVDSNAVIDGQGRFRMTNYGILERLETGSDTLWTINARALVDIRVAQCLAALKVAQPPWSKRVFMPRTGGRWIMTSKKCQRQVLHTDFTPLSRHETLSEKKCPGFFTIATGKSEVPVWVCSHSHRLAATSSAAKMRAASSASTAQMIRIPPFSVFVGRGDLYYSALGTEDAIGEQRSIYYHTFFVPEDDDIPMVLSSHPDFNPRFSATNLGDSSSENESEMQSEEEILPATHNQLRDVDRDDSDHSDDLWEARDLTQLHDEAECREYL